MRTWWMLGLLTDQEGTSGHSVLHHGPSRRQTVTSASLHTTSHFMPSAHASTSKLISSMQAGGLRPVLERQHQSLQDCLLICFKIVNIISKKF